jgi:putative hydrolase of the HAD superfamily
MIKISNKNELHNKIQEFDLIIFDLDDTIYEEKKYDIAALKSVSIYLEKKIFFKRNKIFNDLKKLRFKKSKPLIFNTYLNKLNIPKKKFGYLVKKSIYIFQSYKCENLKKVNSLKKLILNNHKKKLFLVTNGNILRQKNKIYYLGIKKYFKKIYILDGKKTKLKPSIKSVVYLIKQIKKWGNKNSVYIGDNLNVDKNFAKNLKVSFIHFKFN